MAAKLAWRHGDLYLGAFKLGETRWSSSAGGRNAPGYQWRIGDRDWGESYQEDEDVAQDLEREVRALLKTAGVVVE